MVFVYPWCQPFEKCDPTQTNYKEKSLFLFSWLVILIWHGKASIADWFVFPVHYYFLLYIALMDFSTFCINLIPKVLPRSAPCSDHKGEKGGKDKRQPWDTHVSDFSALNLSKIQEGKSQFFFQYWVDNWGLPIDSNTALNNIEWARYSEYPWLAKRVSNFRLVLEKKKKK